MLVRDTVVVTVALIGGIRGEVPITDPWRSDDENIGKRMTWMSENGDRI